MLCRLSIITYMVLHSFCKIKAHPSVAFALVGFQKPPLGCPLAVRFFHNRKGADSRIFPGLCMVSTGSFPDVQVGDGYSHQIRLERCRPGVHRLPGFIKHGMPRILIRTFLCVIQRLERPFLRRSVRPRLPDAVPGFCRLRCAACRAEDAFQDREDFLSIADSRRPSFPRPLKK